MLAIATLDNVKDSEDLWEDWEDISSSRGEFEFFPSDGRAFRTLPDGRTQRLNPVTRSLIDVLPLIHIEEITEENAQEVFIRIRMIEIALGAHLGSQLDVKRHVGLRLIRSLPVKPFEGVVLDALRRQASGELPGSNTSSK